MTTWNYRIVETISKFGSIFAIHEVFYDDVGNPEGLSQKDTSPVGETREEFNRSAELYKKAFKTPALKYDTERDVFVK